MKKRILKLVMVAGICIIGIISCTNSAEQRANRDQAVSDSLARVKAYQDSVNDEIEFRKEAEDKLQANNQKIASLREGSKKEREDIRAKYDKEIDELDQENVKLSSQLHQYKEEGKDQWKKFKHDFNKEMDSLGKSISRLAERNMSKS